MRRPSKLSPSRTRRSFRRAIGSPSRSLMAVRRNFGGGLATGTTVARGASSVCTGGSSMIDASAGAVAVVLGSIAGQVQGPGRGGGDRPRPLSQRRLVLPGPHVLSGAAVRRELGARWPTRSPGPDGRRRHRPRGEPPGGGGRQGYQCGRGDGEAATGTRPLGPAPLHRSDHHHPGLPGLLLPFELLEGVEDEAHEAPPSSDRRGLDPGDRAKSTSRVRGPATPSTTRPTSSWNCSTPLAGSGSA